MKKFILLPALTGVISTVSALTLPITDKLLDAPIVQQKMPWLVDIKMLNSTQQYEHQCGGTLIAPNVLITAAHCGLGDGDASTRFTATANVLNHEAPIIEQGGVAFRVKAIHNHPDFGIGSETSSEFKNYSSDVGIWLLEPTSETSVNLNNLQYADLPTVEALPTDDLHVAGWGISHEEYVRTTGTDGLPYIRHVSISTPQLRETSLELMDRKVCINYAAEQQVHLSYDSIICARPRDQRSVGCHGDSGSGVFVQSPDGHVHLKALFSAGGGPSGCKVTTADVGVMPSVFTNLATFHPWIHATLSTLYSPQK